MITYRSWKMVFAMFSLPVSLISYALPYVVLVLETVPVAFQDAVDHIVAFGHAIKDRFVEPQGESQPRHVHDAKEHVAMLKSIGSAPSLLPS